MKIDRIIFENFRPFYGHVDIDLTTDNDKNIILIGGKNGHGKTNFLLGVVWCLYGELIGKVDKSFKAEIVNNYPQFLDRILNDDKKREGGKEFSVELKFSDVSYGDDGRPSVITVKRSYNIESQKEELSILSIDDEQLVSTDDERRNFINNYLVPMEIARFVFFDAEKISQIADLTTGKQAQLMNNTLGNMLGLNTYQNLLNEIEVYIRSLKRESSTSEVQKQITNIENVIKLSKQSIKTKEANLEEKNSEVAKISLKIEELEIQINKKGDNDNTDMQALHKKRSDLKEQRNEMQIKFNEMTDVIPLLMLSGLLQETKEHIEIEENNKNDKTAQNNFTEKVGLFIEELFNEGEMPTPDISLKQKIFYDKKSTQLVDCFLDDQHKESLAFEHNLDQSKIKDLQDLYNDTKSKSNANLIDIITGFSKKKDDCDQLDRQIKKIELTTADDLTKSLIDSKNNSQSEKYNLIKEIGGLENEISKTESEIITNEKRLSFLYDKAKTNKKNQEKIKLSKKYMKVLDDFIKEEKEEKKETIKNKLLEELQHLWHKQLVNNVELTILPDDKGMEVELFNKSNNTIQSKELSKGEQQIYVSALLKAILDSSIHSLPVLIDTPLGRLDSEHRDNILKNYYPTLSTQVVVFSTDTEITTSKRTEIEEYIANSYLIKNVDGKSSINEGYFT